MANIRREAQKQLETNILMSVKGGAKPTAADREAAQVIAARSMEAVDKLKKMEGKK